ncbi:MAG: DUF192 domain-containing protein [bacterium]|nr:DUF192 domain-containing protein [bacterium]
MEATWKILVVVLGACAAVVVFAGPLMQNIAAVASRREVAVNGQTIIAELVSTPEQMARGLGGRDRLGVNEGMLFSFAAPGIYPFWMKDMRFPIDIVWIRDGRIVGITERIDPQIGAPDAELRSYPPPEPINEVLELMSGRASLLQARVGMPVTMRSLLR